MDLKQKIEVSEQLGLFKSLDLIYKAVPSGTCDGCTRCCHESVNLSNVEGLNIIATYFLNQEGDVSVTKDRSDRLLRFFLREWVDAMKCPFLEGEKCSIYQARPLPCRIFGNRTEEAYAENFRRIQLQNQSVQRSLFKSEGLRLPRRVTAHKIGYCQSYVRTSTLDEEAVNALYDRLIQLDSRLYFEGGIEDLSMNAHLVGFFVDEVILEQSFEIVNRTLLDELKREMLKNINVAVK